MVGRIAGSLGPFGLTYSVAGVELEDRVTMAGAEGIDLHVVLAGLGSRGVAIIVDIVLQTIALVAVVALASLFGDAGLAFAAVGSFMVLLGYQVLAEAFANGQTVGKRMMSIAVVDVDGSPVSFMDAVIRNVLRVVDLLPGTYFVGCVSILATPRNQRVGDLAAGTLVVQRTRDRGPVDDFGYPTGMSIAPVLSPEAAGWDISAVTPEEVAAARSFLVRRHSLDPQHRANLAQTLSFQLLPKVAGVPLDGGPEIFLERIVAAKTSL